MPCESWSISPINNPEYLVERLYSLRFNIFLKINFKAMCVQNIQTLLYISRQAEQV